MTYKKPEDYATFQDALDDLAENGGVLWLEPGKNYVVEPGLTLWRQVHPTWASRWAIEGNMATLDFSGTSATSGTCLKVGAPSSVRFEKGQISISNLLIKGNETVNPASASAPQKNLVGLELDGADNLTLSKVSVQRCWKGLVARNCWPVAGYDLNLRENFAGFEFGEDMTLGTWVNVDVTECWVGGAARPINSRVTYGQRFIKLRLEGCKVGFAFSPQGSSNPVGAPGAIYDYVFDSPHVENNDLAGFVFRDCPLNNPTINGSDMGRSMVDARILAGVWSVNGSAKTIVGPNVSSRVPFAVVDIWHPKASASSIPSAWRQAWQP